MLLTSDDSYMGVNLRFLMNGWIFVLQLLFDFDKSTIHEIK